MGIHNILEFYMVQDFLHVKKYDMPGGNNRKRGASKNTKVYRPTPLYQTLTRVVSRSTVPVIIGSPKP